MDNKASIKLFETKRIRTAWNEDEEEWYFSVVDIIAVLTDQPTQDSARNYWKVLKKRLIEEGNEPVTICNRLKLLAQDGKMRLTDVASTEQVFRIIQSVPFASLTDIICKTWAGKTDKEYKKFKGLKKENLRDNMTNKELVINMLAELSTKEISETSNPATMAEHEDVARRGGNIAREARLNLEAETGKKVVSPLNAKTVLGIKGNGDNDASHSAEN
jgi:hypothetical protein